MASGRLENKLEKDSSSKEKEWRLDSSSAFSSGLILSWNLGNYIPYVALGYYDLLLGAHLI